MTSKYMNLISVKRLMPLAALALAIILITAAMAHFRFMNYAGNCSGWKDSPEAGRAARISYQCGTVNGIKLAIPTNFLMHRVVYVGDERDGFGPASDGATDKSVIDNFGILLRLSTLQPKSTEADDRDWRSALATAKPSFDESWMVVSLDNHYPINKTPGPYQSRMPPGAGPFDLDKNRPYGLVHYESIQSVDESKSFNGHTEYYFNDLTYTTISCQTHRQEVSPFETFNGCSHRFIVPSLNLMAEAFYTKKDLYQWVRIESRVDEIARSFIY
jgi:hypothetical protein